MPSGAFSSISETSETFRYGNIFNHVFMKSIFAGVKLMAINWKKISV